MDDDEKMNDGPEEAAAKSPWPGRYETDDRTTVRHTSEVSITVEADLLAIGMATVFGLAVGLVIGRAAR